jgi:hypothetical protein
VSLRTLVLAVAAAAVCVIRTGNSSNLTVALRGTKGRVLSNKIAVGRNNCFKVVLDVLSLSEIEPFTESNLLV